MEDARSQQPDLTFSTSLHELHNSTVPSLISSFAQRGLQVSEAGMKPLPNPRGKSNCDSSPSQTPGCKNATTLSWRQDQKTQAVFADSCALRGIEPDIAHVKAHVPASHPYSRISPDFVTLQGRLRSWRPFQCCPSESKVNSLVCRPWEHQHSES